MQFYLSGRKSYKDALEELKMKTCVRSCGPFGFLYKNKMSMDSCQI